MDEIVISVTRPSLLSSQRFSQSNHSVDPIIIVIGVEDVLTAKKEMYREKKLNGEEKPNFF